MTKKQVAVVCGGYSGEFDISMKSAQYPLKHVDVEKYDLWQVVLQKHRWYALVNGEKWPIDREDFSVTYANKRINFDVVLNMIHGHPGENGTLEGYFDLLDIPYQSAGVFVSSLTFDKFYCNTMLRSLGVQVAPSILFTVPSEQNERDVVEKIGFPCFVKPNNGGSSIGVSKVNDKSGLPLALKKAFDTGEHVIVEQFVKGTELTCGVIRNENKVRALAVTEIEYAGDFFDYEAKYSSVETQEITPARINEEDYQRCLEISERIYRLLNVKGFFRVDYILSEGKFYVIEVNTVPGMSEKSLLPQQIEYCQIDPTHMFTEEIERLLKPS